MKYVVAVSGGVDSISLLHMLVGQSLELGSQIEVGSTVSKLSELSSQNSFVVAHFDHGIREDSAEDEKFVRGLAEKYGLTYESKRVELGPNTSEDEARKVRYNFLRSCCKKYNAQLITAHHQDDLIETVLINLLRGTGWRGLAAMTKNFPISNQKSIIKNQGVLRPLLDMTKAEILAYAQQHDLSWREDSTNNDHTYLRNYVRQVLLPMVHKTNPDFSQSILELSKNVQTIRPEIESQLQKLIPGDLTFKRYNFIMWPDEVAREVIYTVLTKLDPDWHPSSVQLVRALHFIKSGLSSKDLIISKHLKLSLETTTVQFKKY